MIGHIMERLGLSKNPRVLSARDHRAPPWGGVETFFTKR